MQFLLPVDVRGLDLDDLVSISKGRMQVYGLPGGSAAPALGAQLNVPAMLTFRYLLLMLVLLSLGFCGSGHLQAAQDLLIYPVL